MLTQGTLVRKVVVIDDGSSDGTAALAATQGAPVELVALPHNRGAATARNAGLARCTAEYVAFLDADDRWLPGKLDAQVEALEHAHEAAFAICGVRAFADRGLGADECAALLAQQPAVMEGWLASALLARRSLFARAGNFAEDLRIGETIEWFSRARRYGHVALQDVLVERRMHRSNTTRLAEEQRRDYLLAAHRHLIRQRAEGGNR